MSPTAAHISRIAAATSPEAAQWAFGQWALRDRARDKFARADEMLFDRDGLEMATHERVAAYHASCFPEGVHIQDWTCGIGSDLIAFARGGAAGGYELDRVRATYALHNVEVHGFEASVHVCDCLDAGKAEYAFCDPSRRSGGRRTLNMAEFAPDPFEIAKRFSVARLAGIKLTPMLSDRDLESLGRRLEFVSFGGECREALVWLSADVDAFADRPEPTASRVAVHIESGEALAASGDPCSVSTPATLLYEADPAAIRAHCCGELCSRHRLKALGDSNGYLTGDQVISSPWLKRYEVLACHSADLKRTRSELKCLGGGTPVIKTRGVQLDVEKMRKELRGDGEELVVVVFPDGKSLKHVICRAG